MTGLVTGLVDVSPLGSPTVTAHRITSDMATLTSELEEIHSAAFAWALNCCSGDPGEAEEVLQTVYLKILDGRARFGGRSTLKTWVFAIIRRTAAERRRRRRVRRALRFRWSERQPRIDPPPGPAAEASRREEAVRIRNALAVLSHRQREVLELVFYQDQTVDEAAEILGITVGSARVHYSRGKEKLRVGLADWRPST